MNTMLPHLLSETSCVEDFLRLLAEEAQAMESGRFAELPSLTEQKTALLDRVATLDRARESAQVALGFGPGRAGAEAAAAADGEASQQAWSALLALADRARDNNRRNGSMVWRHLEFTQEALRFMQGGAQPFYGPDGIRKAAGGAGTRLALG